MYLWCWSTETLLVLYTSVGEWANLCSLASWFLRWVLQPERVRSCCFIHQFESILFFKSVFFLYPLTCSIFPFPGAVSPWWELMGTRGWQKQCVMRVCMCMCLCLYSYVCVYEELVYFWLERELERSSPFPWQEPFQRPPEPRSSRGDVL